MMNETIDNAFVEVSIVIVNWNSVEYTQKCIQSIMGNTYGITYEIIVIDGASYDGCQEMIEHNFPEVIFIQSKVNEGFSRANNMAYRKARGKYILFLNPDTEIFSSAIQILLQKLKTLPEAGAVGCTLLNGDGSLQTSCIGAIPTILNQMLDSEFLRKRFPSSPLWGMAALFRKMQQEEEVETISGACIMVKRDVFEEVGLFSRDYFMYAEDTDLCYKIKQAGYRNYYVPGASIVHFGGGSSKQTPSNFSILLMRESTWRFLKKTRGNLYGMGYRLGMLTSALFRLMLILVVVPCWKVFHEDTGLEHSLRKWGLILKWSLGLEKWVHKTG
jgi:GT2 family glycosyltransferase